MAAGDIKIGLGIDIDLQSGKIDDTALRKVLATYLKNLKLPPETIRSQINIEPDVKFQRGRIQKAFKGLETDIRRAFTELDTPLDEIPGLSKGKPIAGKQAAALRDDDSEEYQKRVAARESAVRERGGEVTNNQQAIIDAASGPEGRARIERLLTQVAPLAEIFDKDSLQPTTKDADKALKKVRAAQKEGKGIDPNLSTNETAALNQFLSQRDLAIGQLDKVTKGLANSGLLNEKLRTSIEKEQGASVLGLKDDQKVIRDAIDPAKNEKIRNKIAADEERDRKKANAKQDKSTAAREAHEARKISAEKASYTEQTSRDKGELAAQVKSTSADEAYKARRIKAEKDAYTQDAKLARSNVRDQERAERDRIKKDQVGRGEALVKEAQKTPIQKTDLLDSQRAQDIEKYLAARQARLGDVRGIVDKPSRIDGSSRHANTARISSEIEANDAIKKQLEKQQKFYAKTPEDQAEELANDIKKAKAVEKAKRKSTTADDNDQVNQAREIEGNRLFKEYNRTKSTDFLQDSLSAEKTRDAANRERELLDSKRDKLTSEGRGDDDQEVIALTSSIKKLDGSIKKLDDRRRQLADAEGTVATNKALTKQQAIDLRASDQQKLFGEQGVQNLDGAFTGLSDYQLAGVKQAGAREKTRLNREVASAEGEKKRALDTHGKDSDQYKTATAKLNGLNSEAGNLESAMGHLKIQVDKLKTSLHNAQQVEQKKTKDDKKAAASAEENRETQRRLDQGKALVEGKGGGESHSFKNIKNTAQGKIAGEYLADERAGLRAKQIDLTEKVSSGQRGYVNDLNAVTGALRENDRATQTLNRRMLRFGTAASQTSLLMRQFFRYAVGYHALYAAAGAVQAFAASLVDLDTELHSIQAIAGTNAEELGEIESAIKRIATTTRFTNDEIAKAARTLAQSGVDPAKIREVLTATAQFAAATGGTIQVSADLISTMRKVFDELDSSDIGDKLATAINISKLTAEDLKPILSISAQIAKSYELTADQYLAAVTTLRNAGLKASTVATGLRQGLVELFSPKSRTLEKLQLRYRQIGEVVSQEDITTRFQGFRDSQEPLQEVLKELKRLGFQDEGRRLIGDRSFNIRAENAIKALVSNVDDLAKSQAQLSISGTSLLGSKIQLESLSATMSNLGAIMTVFGDSLTEGAIPTLQNMVSEMIRGIDRMTQFNDKLKADTGTGIGSILTTALSVSTAVFAGTKGSVLQKGRNAVLAGGATAAVGAPAVKALDAAGFDPKTILDFTTSMALAFPVMALAVEGIKKVGIGSATRVGRVRERIINRQDRVLGRQDAARYARTGGPTGGGRFRPDPRIGRHAIDLGLTFVLMRDLLGSIVAKLRGAGVLGALKGLLGKTTLIGIALSTVAAALGLWYKEADDAKKAIGKYQQGVRNLQAKLGEVTEIDTEAETIRFSDSEAGTIAKEGSSSHLIESLDANLKQIDTDLERWLGVRAEPLSEILKSLNENSTAGSASRNYILGQLAEQLGGEVGDSVASLITTQKDFTGHQIALTRAISDLSGQYVAASDAVGGFREKLFAQYEQILALEAKGTELSAGEAALKKAVNDPNIGLHKFGQLSGDIAATPEDLRRLLEDILRAMSTEVEVTLEKAREANRGALDAQVAQLVDVSLALPTPADLRQTINSLAITAKRLGEEPAIFLLKLQKQLEEARDAFELDNPLRPYIDPNTAEYTVDSGGQQLQRYGGRSETDKQGRALYDAVVLTQEMRLAAVDAARAEKVSKETVAEKDARNLVSRFRELPPELQVSKGDREKLSPGEKFTDIEREERASFGIHSPPDSLIAAIESLEAQIAMVDAQVAAGTRDKLEEPVFTSTGGGVAALNNAKQESNKAEAYVSQLDKLTALYDTYRKDIELKTKIVEDEQDIADQRAAVERDAIRASRKYAKDRYDNEELERQVTRNKLQVDQKNLEREIELAQDLEYDDERFKQLPTLKSNLVEAIRLRAEFERQATFARSESLKLLLEAEAAYSLAMREAVISRQTPSPAELQAASPDIEDTDFLPTAALETYGTRGQAYQRQGAELNRLDRFGLDLPEGRLREVAQEADNTRDTIGIKTDELQTFREKTLGVDESQEQRDLGIQARIKELEELNRQLGGMNAEIDQLQNTAWDEIKEGFNFETLAEGFESAGTQLEDFGESINSIIVHGFSDLGSAFTKAIREGQSFSDAVRQMAANVADSIADMVANMAAQAAVAAGLRFLQGLGGAFGSAGDAGATTGQASGIGGGDYGNVARDGISDVALLRTGIADVAEILSDSSPVRRAEGGLISGAGTGTSDSIFGVITNDKGQVRKGIRVSDGEAILNAKATSALGKQAIDAINRGASVKMATGGVVSAGASIVANSTPGGQTTSAYGNEMAGDKDPGEGLKIVNIVDKGLFDDYLTSTAGDRTLVNRIRKNSRAIRQVLR